MTIDEFNHYCKALPHTTHVVQWGNSEVWKVGGKVFAIGSISKDGHPAFTFKTSEQNYYFLEEKPGLMLSAAFFFFELFIKLSYRSFYLRIMFQIQTKSFCYGLPGNVIFSWAESAGYNYDG